LADIVRYIARHNSDAAARLGFELITRAESLADFPEIGRVVPEENDAAVREIVLRPYRIIYKVFAEKQMVAIARVWHGARGEPDIPGETKTF